jgi:tetratricopeptide (TPR) repeat protein
MEAMRKGYTIGLVILLVLVITAVLSYWAFPRVVAALPAEVRLYLPEEVIRAASTPLPTALPAPELSAQPIALIPTLAFPTPTLPPTFTAVPFLTTPITNHPLPITTSLPITDNRSPITPHPLITPSPHPLPAQIRLEGVAVIPQKFNNCGPANLTMNLAYYGHAVHQLDVAAQIRPQYEDRNVTPWELAGYVNEQTPLRAAVFSGGDLETLKRLLANGYPVVIEKGYEPNDWQGWMGHYLTLVGYDDTTQEFIALDTFLGPWDSSGRWESYDFIENYWQHFNNTFYLVYPPEEETAVHALIGPTLTDPLTMWQQAAQKAQAETAASASPGQAADPTNPYAWFNLGSSLTELGQLTDDQSYFENAAAAFDQARTIGLPWRMLWYQFQLYEAYLAVGRTDDVLTLANATLSSGGGQEEAYYYRGLAYLAQGYPEQARLDFQQAITWNPTFSAAQEALEAVNSEQ